MMHFRVRKAAILLMSMPDNLAAQLLTKLDPKQVEAVSIEIAKISNISGDEQEQVMQNSAIPTRMLYPGAPADWKWLRTLWSRH